MEGRSTREEICARQAMAMRARSILVWGSRLLLTAGGLALCAVSVVYVQTYLCQHYLKLRFLREPDAVGASGMFGSIVARSFALSSSPTEKRVTNADPPSSATPQSATLPPRAATVGQIVIPAVGLTAMVLEGDDEHTLRLAVGHIPGTAIPGPSGNVGLAGHRDTFFRPLRKMNVGDEIRFFTRVGIFKYRVVSLRIVLPDAIDVLDVTKRPTLTLVTCYPFYYIGAAPKRFIVHAEMVPASPK
jgi:sortase A